MEKKCSKCDLIKPLTEFNKRTNSKDGLRFECKSCQKVNYTNNRERYIGKMKENRKNKLDEYKKRDKDYYESNKEKILNKKREYHINNQEKILNKKREYYYNNKEKRNEYNKQWIKDNIEYYRDHRKKYSKEYRKKYPHIILWRSILACTLIRFNKPKENSTIDLLGYSALELKKHIELLFTDGMSWDNYGEWHIDHIKDVILFDNNTPMNIVNALSNLRPMWATTREINGVVYEGNLNKQKHRIKK